MGRRRRYKLNEHKVLNLSPFAVIFDNTERTPSVDQDAARECTEPGARADGSWAALAAIAGDANGFCVVLRPRSLLSMFFFYFFGRAHDDTVT